MTDLKTLIYHVEDGLATLTLNRPQAKNSLSLELTDELQVLLPQIRRDPAVKALILTGAGGAFCSGGDVRAMGQSGPRSPEQIRQGMERYRRITLDLMGLEIPVIAAVDGVAYGAGFSIALMADIMLVSDRARLCMVFQRIGLVPDMGAFYTLPRAVGMQRAKEIMLSAREIGPAEALSLGLAMEVLAPDALMARAQAMGRSFCGASEAALRLGKRAINASLQSSLETMLDVEAMSQGIAGSSDYLKEAARRFMAKEPPQFVWPPRADN